MRPHARLCWLIVAFCFLAPEPVPAGTDEETIPPGRTHYMGRQIPPPMHHTGAPWLVRGSREQEENSTLLMAQLKLEEGQVVCDLGCGNGYYTLKLAREVGPEGRVYAVDIQPEMLEMLEERVEEAELSNVQSVLGTVIDPKLPPGSCDVILLVDVYHEFSHPEHMLAAIREALKPEGVMVLVEFRLEDPQVPIHPLHKMTRRQIMREIPRNGFRLAREFDGLPWQHMMFFQRDDAPPDEEEDPAEAADRADG